MTSAPRQPAPYEAHDDLGAATATDGLVMVDGPGATALTLTPDAADKLAHALIAAAQKARTPNPPTK